MSGIIAEEEAAVSSSILVPMACMPPLLSVILSSSLRFGVLRQNSWGPGGGQKWSRRGGGVVGGRFLKGSSQWERPWSQCQQTRGGERGHPCWFCTPPFQILCSIVAQCGVCWAEKHWWRTVLRMRCCPCEVELELSSLRGREFHPICAVEAPGCPPAAWCRDCLIGGLLKAETSYCVLTWHRQRRQNQIR